LHIAGEGREPRELVWSWALFKRTGAMKKHISLFAWVAAWTLMAAGNSDAGAAINHEPAVLGHVAHSGGYPSSSVQTVWSQDQEPPRKLGDAASEYELVFEDGPPEIIPLRHGLEILRANEICRWWAVNPVAPGSRPGLRVVVHPSFEILRVDLWEHSLDRPRPRKLKELRWKLVDEQSVQALWGVSVEGE
jgi:hypothetical protein